MDGQEYLNTRQQNYLFAYNIVPAFLFRSDFARIFSLPNGFGYTEKYWKRLAQLLPAEQVVSDDPLATATYQLADGIYCLLVTMPTADRYLELQYLAIVFQPQVRYFVVGRSGLPGMGESWTIREVKPKGHGRCGMLSSADSQQFLEQIVRVLEVTPQIRLVNSEELQKYAGLIETFPAEFQMTSPDEVLALAATYKLISLQTGDTSGILATTVCEFFQQGGEEVHQAVTDILAGNPINVAQIQSPDLCDNKRWWEFWK